MDRKKTKDIKRGLGLFFLSLIFLLPARAQRAQDVNLAISRLLATYEAARDSSLREPLSCRILQLCLRCDSLETAAGGKYRYREKNYARTVGLVQPLVTHAMQLAIAGRKTEAIDRLTLYLRCADSPLYPGEDKRKHEATYALGLFCYDAQHYADAEHYADMALTSDPNARDAAELKVKCMRQQMTTQEDSARYVLTLLELHKADVRNQTFHRLLLDYYAAPGKQQEFLQFAKDETRRQPEDLNAWLLRGDVEMRNALWEPAAKSFKHALLIDSAQIKAIYNTGVCYAAMGKALRDSLSGNGGKLKRKDASRVKDVFRQALPFLIKVQDMDPRRETVDWLNTLYLVLYVLKDKRAEQLEPLINRQSS